MKMQRKLMWIIALVLVLGTVLGVATLADINTSPSLAVEAFNLSFEDSVYLVYAVSSENVTADQVQMLFWTEPKASKDAYTKGTESYSTANCGDVTYDGKDCKMFKYTKLRAKNMTDDIYARAYIEVEGQAYYSDVVKYSVLQYAYNKLGITGTATQNSALKDMLTEMLEYGAKAQTFADYRTDRLATDTFYQLKVTDGTLADGFAKGLYAPGEQVALKAAATSGGKSFIGWEKNGHTVSLDASAKLTMTHDHTTVTACYGTPFTPVVRFAVSSDLHWRSSTKENPLQSADNTQLLFETAYDYSTSRPYNELDGIFIAGDYTQNGSEAEMSEFYELANRLTRGDTIVRTVLGNHEYWTAGAVYKGEEQGTRYGPQSIAATYERHLRYGQYEEVDQHLVINGFHFILLSMDRYNDGYIDENGNKITPPSGTNFYSDEKLVWLEAEIQKAVADDATGEKPIFIFHHVRASNSGINNNNGTLTSGDTDLEPILNRYPQVVDFSGHTHCSLTDPRTIFQTGYTAINTGSLAYLRATLINYKDGKYYTEASTGMDNQGTWGTGDIETATRNACLYFIVEVDVNNNIRLVINNIYTGAIEDVILLGKVGDPDNFYYNETRRANANTPKFANNAKLETKFLTKKSVQLVIPQAECPDGMNSYRVEIYKDDTLVTTVYRLACQYLGGAMPETIIAPIMGLSSSTVYTAKIYPVSYWGIEGEPLVGRFVTRSTTDANTSLDKTPDIFSMGLNTDHTAYNAVDGTALAVTGAPTVVYDNTLKRNVVYLNGSSAYRFLDIGNYYDIMSESFTFEIYVYMDEVPSSSYVDIVSNQQAGGFGFELKSGGNLQFIITLGGSSSARPSTTLPGGEWVHIVVTYDGSTLSMYKNGVLVSTAAPNEGSIKPPTSQYLVIGGDSNATTSGDYFMTGKIAVTNLYAAPLTAGEVAALYNSY
ncbi:MAG: metallophosphoesterase [Clostridia bacterium]|nr:metallophosphoesterase [Clostridia bacterium]